MLHATKAASTTLITVMVVILKQYRHSDAQALSLSPRPFAISELMSIAAVHDLKYSVVSAHARAQYRSLGRRRRQPNSWLRNSTSGSTVSLKMRANLHAANAVRLKQFLDLEWLLTTGIEHQSDSEHYAPRIRGEMSSWATSALLCHFTSNESLLDSSWM